MAEQKEEAAKKRQRNKTDLGTKRRFQIARGRLGLSANATGSIKWRDISKRTTFAWKCDNLADTARWVARESFAAIQKWPLVSRTQIIVHYIELGFGIAPVDLLGSNRVPPIVIPRFIAMVILFKSGLSKAEAARRFKKDHTTLKTALAQTGALLEGISFNDQLENTCPFRSPLDGQPSGEVPAPVHPGPSEDHQ